MHGSCLTTIVSFLGSRNCGSERTIAGYAPPYTGADGAVPRGPARFLMRRGSMAPMTDDEIIERLHNGFRSGAISRSLPPAPIGELQGTRDDDRQRRPRPELLSVWGTDRATGGVDAIPLSVHGHAASSAL